MIKVENINIWGFEHAIRGMRNPKNSWEKSDSWYERGTENNIDRECYFKIGPNDMKLMQTLFKGGTEHRKYLRQIFVSMDITAPLYWWKEFDTYKVGTVSNSCSTMHKIAAKDFEFADFSHEHLLASPKTTLYATINELNSWRELYLGRTDPEEKKECWWQMIQLLPSSYNQRRTITMNYENVFTILRQRRGHKLDEWNTLCDIFETLPYVKEIGGRNDT